MTDQWWRDAPTRTIPAEGGVRARSRRGTIGRTWWSQRFLGVLESLGLGGRLERGRRYARSGQVLSMALSKSIVVAQVQGSRPDPYRVRIGVKALDEEQWREVERAMAGQALFLAALLAGDMPEDIEAVFAEVGLRLFPDTLRELSMDCSCPDWEIPCKHLAATCYLLAESFDADPFEILAWRGRGRQELLDNLRALRERSPASAAEDADPPLSSLLDSFWTAPAVPASREPGGRAVLLDQLDPLPVMVRGKPFTDLLRPAYPLMADPVEESG